MAKSIELATGDKHNLKKSALSIQQVGQKGSDTKTLFV